jgi:pimeloyl-ACP methyl ester carboxylesterase
VLKDLFHSQGYEIVVVGHSLGAGTAVLLAILLKEELGLKKEHSFRFLSFLFFVRELSLMRTRMMTYGVLMQVRAFGFATPPVTDIKTAKRCAGYITSVSHQTDVITRASLANLQAGATHHPSPW